MAKQNLANMIILLLNLGALLVSLACHECPHPTPPPNCPPPPIPKPPYVPVPVPKPPPPVVKPPPYAPKSPKPPVISPPILPPKPPVYPSPPIVKPPPTPSPPILPPNPPVHPSPPVVKPPPVEKPCPPPPPSSQQTCPIDTLKLGACVDVLAGLVHVGIGKSAKDTCCPVLQGLLDLDAAVCLCTTIKAKLLNVKIILPIALQLLIGCGKTPPPGFQCPA